MDNSNNFTLPILLLTCAVANLSSADEFDVSPAPTVAGALFFGEGVGTKPEIGIVDNSGNGCLKANCTAKVANDGMLTWILGFRDRYNVWEIKTTGQIMSLQADLPQALAQVAAEIWEKEGEGAVVQTNFSVQVGEFCRKCVLKCMAAKYDADLTHLDASEQATVWMGPIRIPEPFPSIVASDNRVGNTVEERKMKWMMLATFVMSFVFLGTVYFFTNQPRLRHGIGVPHSNVSNPRVSLDAGDGISTMAVSEEEELTTEVESVASNFSVGSQRSARSISSVTETDF